MIDIKPKKYSEILRLKNCYTLIKYFSSITENMFIEIYEFLGENEYNSIMATQNVLAFANSDKEIVKSYAVSPKNISFDKIRITNKKVYVTQSYGQIDYSSSTVKNPFDDEN